MSASSQALRKGVLPPRRQMQTRAGALQYITSGTGSPSIVLMNGAGVTLDGWRALLPAIQGLGTVFAWNRFGVMGSDDPQRAQSGALVIGSLRELLAYAGLAPPYVLVGHSMGGLYANLFARLYPQEVSAVMFLEATHPRDGEALPAHEDQIGCALAKVLALPQRLFRANLHSELQAASCIALEIEAAGPFPAVPLCVITGVKRPPKWLVREREWLARAARQEELARASPLGTQVFARGSGHFPQLSEPRFVAGELASLCEASRKT